MTDSTEKTKQKRRWMRFNLRSFLIIITIICAWVGWYVYRAEQQRAAVQWVQENGGTVYYGFKLDPNDRAPSTKVLNKMFGVDYWEWVVEVRLLDSQVGDLTPMGRTNEAQTFGA